MAKWGDLDRPADIYIDANDTVYVSDLKPSVVIMDKKGNKTARWDSPNGCTPSRLGSNRLANLERRSLRRRHKFRNNAMAYNPHDGEIGACPRAGRMGPISVDGSDTITWTGARALGVERPVLAAVAVAGVFSS
jgi:hypothetical protein